MQITIPPKKRGTTTTRGGTTDTSTLKRAHGAINCNVMTKQPCRRKRRRGRLRFLTLAASTFWLESLQKGHVTAWPFQSSLPPCSSRVSLLDRLFCQPTIWSLRLLFGLSLPDLFHVWRKGPTINLTMFHQLVLRPRRNSWAVVRTSCILCPPLLAKSLLIFSRTSRDGRLQKMLRMSRSTKLRTNWPVLHLFSYVQSTKPATVPVNSCVECDKFACPASTKFSLCLFSNIRSMLHLVLLCTYIICPSSKSRSLPLSVQLFARLMDRSTLFWLWPGTMHLLLRKEGSSSWRRMCANLWMSEQKTDLHTWTILNPCMTRNAGASHDMNCQEQPHAVDTHVAWWMLTLLCVGSSRHLSLPQPPLSAKEKKRDMGLFFAMLLWCY